MSALNSIQKQALIDLKNRLKAEAETCYNLASIEENEIKQWMYIAEEKVKENIAKEIEDILLMEEKA